MTNQQKEQITALRSQGYGYATIANAVGLKKDTVVAFCRKIGLTGTKAADNSRIELDAGFCLQCGALLNEKILLTTITAVRSFSLIGSEFVSVSQCPFNHCDVFYTKLFFSHLDRG